MVKQDTDCIFRVKSSRLMPILQTLLWGVAGVVVGVGPFLSEAKMAFLLVWFLLAGYYIRQIRRQQSYAQLRFTNGSLLLVFRNGLEPQLVKFAGAQRILPWLVELNLRLENGQRVRWGVVSDTMDAESFRQLKVFVQTRTDQLQAENYRLGEHL